MMTLVPRSLGLPASAHVDTSFQRLPLPARNPPPNASPALFMPLLLLFNLSRTGSCFASILPASLAAAAMVEPVPWVILMILECLEFFFSSFSHLLCNFSDIHDVP